MCQMTQAKALTAIAAALALAALLTGCGAQVSATFEVVSDAESPAAFPNSVEVNGKTLALDCQGSGSPTVILESGTDDPIDFMSPIQARLADRFLVCAYERAKATELRTATDANDDLHALLSLAAIPGPYVLVGQSLGGELVQLYARTYPDDVAGVVAMNSGPPCGPWLAALPDLGNARLFADETAICADNGASRDRFDLNASWAEEGAAPAPPSIPFELVISTADGDWCPPGDDAPAPFESREQCLAAWAIHEGIARDIVATWPMGHFSTLDGPHPLWTAQLDAVTDLIVGVADRGQTFQPG
jgi:pimeloyl-ACP methyl ester carboxylesterase